MTTQITDLQPGDQLPGGYQVTSEILCIEVEPNSAVLASPAEYSFDGVHWKRVPKGGICVDGGSTIIFRAAV